MKKPILTDNEINNFKKQLIKLLEKYDVYIYSSLEGGGIEIVDNRNHIEIIRVEGDTLGIYELKKL